MFLHSKRNHQQNEMTNYWTGENICKQCDWQGANIQNTHIAHKTQYQKRKNAKWLL